MLPASHLAFLLSNVSFHFSPFLLLVCQLARAGTWGAFSPLLNLFVLLSPVCLPLSPSFLYQTDGRTDRHLRLFPNCSTLQSSAYIICLFMCPFAKAQCCNCLLSLSQMRRFLVVTPGRSDSLSLCFSNSLASDQLVSLGWGRGQPSGPQQTLSISIPFPACPCLTTQAAPCLRDLSPHSSLISLIDSCQSRVWAVEWQGETLIDSWHVCVYVCLPRKLVAQISELSRLKFVHWSKILGLIIQADIDSVSWYSLFFIAHTA